MRNFFLKVMCFKVIIIFCVFVLSCNNTNTQNDKFDWDNIAKQTINSGKIYSVQNKEVIQISIDEAEEVKMYDFWKRFVKTAKYLHLNSKEPIGSVDYALVEGDRIFVLDRYISRRVFIFDKHGNFINYAGSVGQGPGEYLAPESISIRQGKTMMLAVCDKNLFVNYYDFDGNFIKREKRFFGSFCISHEDKFYNPLSYGMFSKDLESNFEIVCTAGDSVVKHGFKLFPIHKKTAVSMDRLRYNNNDLLFTPTLSDTTYTVKNDSVFEVRFIFEHERSIWQDKYLQQNLSEFELIKSNRLTEIYLPITETHSFISFKVQSWNQKVSRHILHQYWYDKSTHKSYKYMEGIMPKIKNNTLTNPISYPINVYQNSFIAYFNPGDIDLLRELKNKYKVKFSNNDLYSLLDNKETDQVLVFYELEDSQLQND